MMKGRLISAFSWNLANLILVQVFNLARVMVLGRILEAADFGLFGMATAVISGVTIFGEFGFKQALIALGEQEEHRQRKWLNSIWTADLLAKLALTVALMALAYPAASLFNDERLILLLLVLSFMPIIGALGNPGMYALEKQLAFKRIAILEIFSSLLGTCLVVVMAFWLRSVWALAIGYLAGCIISTVMSYAISNYRPSFALDREILRKSIQFGKHLLLIGLLTYLTTQFDNLVIGKWLGAATLGVYVIAYRLSELPTLILSTAVNRIMLPYLSNIRRNDINGLQKTWFRTYLVTVYFAFIMYLPMLIFPTWIVTLLFGAKWDTAGQIVNILALAGFFRALARSLGPVFQAIGRTDIDAKCKMVEVSVFVPGVLVAAYLQSLPLIAWMVVLSYGIAFILRIGFIIKILKLSFGKLIVSTGQLVIAAAISSTIVLWLKQTAIATPLVQCIFLIILFASIALMLSSELRAVISTIKKRPSINEYQIAEN